MKTISLKSLVAVVALAASLAACTSATTSGNRYETNLNASAIGGAR
ncbi:hypothetical protein [Telmatospirillum siberiense]|nr:hypothetical protein [Telmatospirillum siberiense]